MQLKLLIRKWLEILQNFSDLWENKFLSYQILRKYLIREMTINYKYLDSWISWEYKGVL